MRITKEQFLSLFSFLTVGASTAVIKFVLFTLFYKGFSMHYQLAVTVAYVLGICFHFTANRHFSFKSRGAGVHTQLSKYAILTLFNYLLTLYVMHFFVESLHLSPYIGFAASLILTASLGFTVMRLWVFANLKG